jgi:hypothetical protein
MDELVRILVSLSDKDFVCEALELCLIQILNASEVYMLYGNALLFAPSGPNMGCGRSCSEVEYACRIRVPATPR